MTPEFQRCLIEVEQSGIQQLTNKSIINGPLFSLLAKRIIRSKSIPDSFQNCAGDYLNARIILIGEKPSGISPFKRSYPFNETENCSGWLNSLLIENSIDDSNLFWVNAVNLDGTENNKNIITTIKYEKILCLGKVAEKWASKNGWAFESFAHPQYWKRFKRGIEYPLVSRLIQLSSIRSKS
jgi:hypothetical protein